MHATAISKMVKAVWDTIRGRAVKIVKLVIAELNKISNKCPAIMFAASRTERVIGRIRFLTVSIRTIKGISIRGVPAGIKWTRRLLALFFQAINIVVNQIGKDSAKVKDRWAEGVKM